MMKKIRNIILFITCFFPFILNSCALTSIATDSVSTALSGSNKRGISVAKKKDTIDPMTAVTGETDVTLVSDFFPTALKLYEIMHYQNPKHKGLTIMTGALNIMYANAFVQAPADFLPNEEYDKQHAEYERAELHYLRGRDFCLDVLDARHEGFKNAVVGSDRDYMQKNVSRLDSKDVEAAYWVGAGWLGAFSLDPLNPDLIGSIYSPVAILEKAASLNPDYNGGAIWDILSNFYISAPAEFGGNTERALYCHNQALRVSAGKSPGPYITYAESFCVPANDEQGFETALNAALAINPDDNPSSRLITTIQQKKAKWLLDHKDDYFVHW